MENIITGLITGLVAIIVCIMNNRAQQRRADVEQDKKTEEISRKHEASMMQIEANISQKIAVLECKMDELTHKVEKHNQVVERTYACERDIEVLREKQSVANNRIKDLEAK